jgi:hypothetical protein
MKGGKVEKVMLEEGMGVTKQLIGVGKNYFNSLEFCWRELTILLLSM